MWSNLRIANRLIAFTVITSFAIYIHIPILFQIGSRTSNGPLSCYPAGISNTYRFILSILTLIYFGILPSLCMLLLGLLTIRNVQQSRRQVEDMITSNQNNRRLNRQMLRLLSVQVFVYSITGLAYSAFTIVFAILETQRRNVVQMAQERLSVAIIGLLSNLGPYLSFYLFTFSSALFRKELTKTFCTSSRIGQQSIQTENERKRNAT